jgi:hypothetical protein
MMQTPLPATPPSLAPISQPADTVYEPRRGGLAKTLVALVLLFAIGIGAGLYVTRDGGSTTDSQAGVADDEGSATQTSATPLDAAAIEADASELTVERGSNAGSADVGGGGSGSAAQHMITVKPPPKKPPPKKPPPKKPPPAQGSGTGSAVIEKPPPKKCDPFENKNGCK